MSVTSSYEFYHKCKFAHLYAAVAMLVLCPLVYKEIAKCVGIGAVAQYFRKHLSFEGSGGV